MNRQVRRMTAAVGRVSTLRLVRFPDRRTAQTGRASTRRMGVSALRPLNRVFFQFDHGIHDGVYIGLLLVVGHLQCTVHVVERQLRLLWPRWLSIPDLQKKKKKKKKRPQVIPVTQRQLVLAGVLPEALALLRQRGLNNKPVPLEEQSEEAAEEVKSVASECVRDMSGSGR